MWSLLMLVMPVTSGLMHVGAVEPAAQARFDHGDVHLAARRST